MTKDFSVEILTPARKLAVELASEVVLPAYDGECGVLAEHKDFVGLLGTGPVKLIKEGNDFWYMVSSGIYKVTDGKLSILAEMGLNPDEIQIEQTRDELSQVEQKLAEKEISKEDLERLSKEQERLKAIVEVHRRTTGVH